MSGAFTLGLVGHPVSHSLSPQLHGAALSWAGLVGSYTLLDRTTEQLPMLMDELRRGRWSGLNVTVPHKRAMAELVDHRSSTAAKLGVVNTLVRDAQGSVTGHNTDLGGLIRALQGLAERPPWVGGRVCVLGAGGAARAALVAAEETGAAEVSLWNRTHGRALNLAEEMDRDVEVCPAMVDALRGADLVIQASSMGLGAAEGSEAWAAVESEATRALTDAQVDAPLMDLVYATSHTPWVSAARRRGQAAQDGRSMLVHQAALAFELWTGREVPYALMAAALPSPQ